MEKTAETDVTSLVSGFEQLAERFVSGLFARFAALSGASVELENLKASLAAEEGLSLPSCSRLCCLLRSSRACSSCSPGRSRRRAPRAVHGAYSLRAWRLLWWHWLSVSLLRGCWPVRACLCKPFSFGT